MCNACHKRYTDMQDETIWRQSGKVSLLR
jgi:hypothetical protein